MNECPDQERTLAWLYGHAAEEQLHHVVGCEACRALVDEHERVAGAVAAVAPALRHKGPLAGASRSPVAAGASRSPVAAGVPPAVLPGPAWRPGLWAAGALLAAAVALIAIGVAGPERAAPPVAEATPVAPSWDEVDFALDDLDAEVEALADNLDM